MDLEKEARELLLRNRRRSGDHQYTIPSPNTYPYQWLWDSCFHAIVLAQFDPHFAKEELRSLVAKQFPDGMIPHIIFWKPRLATPYHLAWGSHGTSWITQPPMLAYAIWEIHRRAPDKAFLEEMYAPTLAFYRYFIEKRDPENQHLCGIINPDESGEDNSPRFDAPMKVNSAVSYARHLILRHKLPNRIWNFQNDLSMKKDFWVKDVPFNVILIRNLQALGHIASFLGHEVGEHFALQHEELIKNAMREKLFSDGVFWSSMNGDDTPLRVATWAHFAPLFAGLYTKEEADVLMEKHFRNAATFRAPFGVRTVSKEEPSYRPHGTGFWRGPIWFAPHWFIYKGLCAYGYKDDAIFVRNANIELIEQNGFREYFNPETGKGYGAKNFTWGTLTLDMMEQ